MHDGTLTLITLQRLTRKGQFQASLGHIGRLCLKKKKKKHKQQKPYDATVQVVDQHGLDDQF